MNDTAKESPLIDESRSAIESRSDEESALIEEDQQPLDEPRIGLSRVIPRQAGMTLVEIMIVLTIMAGIMAFAAFNVVGYLKSAKITTCRGEVSQIRGFIETFMVMHNRLPTELEELEQEVDGMGAIGQVPDDPWENPYEYHSNNSSTFELFSMGPDGQNGNDDDIYPEGMGPQ